MKALAPSLAGRKVCLVTSGSIGSDPRLIKEAHALVGAGAVVRVVAVGWKSPVDAVERDAVVLARVPWACDLLDPGTIFSQRVRSVARRAARALWTAGVRTETIARVSYQPLIGRLGRLAKSKHADLFIAHNLPALPATADAARFHAAKLGFDAEDFHSGQFADSQDPDANCARYFEGRYLPHCDYVSAASDGIGDAYSTAYEIRKPVTILNVFALDLAPPDAASARSSPSLYWFSQTIGAGRGLELALRAIAASRSRPVLHVQGSSSGTYPDSLKRLAHSLGIADRIAFLPAAAPDDLPRIAAQFDAGLATELADTPNRRICLSNKVFTYLLAGIPVLATDTPAQTELAAELPTVLRLLPLDDPRRWAEIIDALLLDAPTLASARLAASAAARNRFNWDLESRRFLDTASRVLQSRALA
jgi:glycosyltransferase involved in cell wall biosynthesis